MARIVGGWFAVAVAVSIVHVGRAAAQCTKDLDCKGDRICVEGRCQMPTGPSAAQEQRTPSSRASSAPTQLAQPNAAQPADPGWALEAGIAGLVTGAVVLSLAIGADITKDDKEVAVGIGAGATVLTAAMGPVVAVGAGSARRGGNVDGCMPCRLVGWVGYGLAIADALVLIGLGLGDVTPPDGIPTTVGLLGATAMTNLSVDALISAAQAKRQAAHQPATATRFGHSPSAKGDLPDNPAHSPVFAFAPFAAPYRSATTGGTGTLVGLSGRF